MPANYKNECKTFNLLAPKAEKPAEAEEETK
jgi:hypothetical protein